MKKSTFSSVSSTCSSGQLPAALRAVLQENPADSQFSQFMCNDATSMKGLKLRKALRQRSILLFTATMAFSALLLPVAISLAGTGNKNKRASLDIYGGDASSPCSTGGTAYFYAAKDAQDQRWWFCDPAGNRFFMNSVEVVDGSEASGYGTVMTSKYGNTTYGGYGALINRLKNYGFNAIGDNSSLYALPAETVSGSGNPTQAPFIYLYEGARGNRNQGAPFKDLFSTSSPSYTGWRADTLPDVFDPNFTTHANATTTADSPWGTSETFTSFSALDANPWLIGVEVGDTDDLASFKISQPPSQGVGWHIGWLAATAAPYEVYSGRWYMVFSNPAVQTKQAWTSWLRQTDNGGPGYETIQALNSAWGSNYSTFGSSGAGYSEVIGTGNGKTTSFSYTLKHRVVDPMSVAIVMGSSIVSGDCPWFDNVGWYVGGSPYDCGQDIPTNTGVIGSQITTYSTTGQPTTSPAATSGGTIDYTTGQLTVTFARAPASGTQISVNYTAGGWPHSLTGGTGLLDEDGTNSWFPAQWYLPGLLDQSPPKVDLDLDNFMTYYAADYFSITSSAVRKLLPHHLVLSPSFLGAYDRPGILDQAAKHLDVIDLQEVDKANQLSVAYGLVNKPIYLDERFVANPDSQFSGTPCDTSTNPQLTCQSTQAARGQAYNSTYQRDRALKGTDGYGFIVGWNFLEMTDITGENMNYGLFSQLDNAYNGTEDRKGPQPCAPEETTLGYVCGNAPGDYTNFLTSVQQANTSWLGNTQ